MNTQTLDLKTLEDLLKQEPAKAASMIRAATNPDNLQKGIDPIDQGARVLVAAQVEGDHIVELTADTKRIVKLQHVEGNLYAAICDLDDGAGFAAEYRVDGKAMRSNINFEVYAPNVYTMDPPGGMKGELRSMGEWKSQIFPNTTRQWYVYLPPNLDKNHEYNLLVGQDAQWDRHWLANALENCARDGKIQPTVGVFIEPGQDRPGNYSNRSVEYDPLNDHYVTFLLTEMLPQVEKIVKLSHDRAHRAITGMSSGGICSFTACWERPDSFGTAISFIGSFANIASGSSKKEGGHNYPFLIRKSDKKPIRVYLQDGSNDLDNEHGNWFLCNLQMMKALQYKGYDVVWVPGQGFHSTKHARRVFDQALAWWQKSLSKSGN